MLFFGEEWASGRLSDSLYEAIFVLYLGQLHLMLRDAPAGIKELSEFSFNDKILSFTKNEANGSVISDNPNWNRYRGFECC